MRTIALLIVAALAALSMFLGSCASSRWAVRDLVCDREICGAAAAAVGWTAVGAGHWNPAAEMCLCRMLGSDGREQDVYVVGKWWTPPDAGAQ